MLFTVIYYTYWISSLLTYSLTKTFLWGCVSSLNWFECSTIITSQCLHTSCWTRPTHLILYNRSCDRDKIMWSIYITVIGSLGHVILIQSNQWYKLQKVRFWVLAICTYYWRYEYKQQVYKTSNYTLVTS